MTLNLKYSTLTMSMLFNSQNSGCNCRTVVALHFSLFMECAD